jgi:hypothetical protein
MSQDETLVRVKDIIRENLNVGLSLDLSSKDVKTRRNFQHLSCLKPKEKEVRSLLEVLLSHAIHAEVKCPQSGIYFLRLFCELEVQDRQDASLRSKQDILNLLKSRNYSKFVLSLLEESLNLSSSTTKIVLKKSTTNSSYIELSEGFTFDLTSLLRSHNQEVNNTRVACIDGYIENVSEIHHLLSHFSESGTSCLLVARGFSNDVLSTININNDRKTFSVYPYRCSFDVENVNILVDLAVASGTDVVSTTKGNLISSIHPKDLGYLHNCIFSTSYVRAKTKDSSSVKNHINNLKKNAEEREEISDLLHKRIRSLTSSSVEICIPDDINFYARSNQIDEGIRIISSVMNNTYRPIDISKIFYKSFQDNFEKSSKFLL